MNSQAIKTAFTAAGIKVRVKTLRNNRFRVCRAADVAHGDESIALAASLGLTDCFGRPGADILQPHELVCNAAA